MVCATAWAVFVYGRSCRRRLTVPETRQGAYFQGFGAMTANCTSGGRETRHEADLRLVIGYDDGRRDAHQRGRAEGLNNGQKVPIWGAGLQLGLQSGVTLRVKWGYKFGFWRCK